jgi:tRNA-modifying protein YgfZ
MHEYYYQFNPLLFRFRGKDVARYLNSRLTNDIKGLPLGGSCLAAALNPQGRTEGFFTVYRLDEGEFLLACDGGDGTAVVAALLRYKVADRIEYDDISPETTLVHVSSSVAELLANEGKLPPLASQGHFSIKDGLLITKRIRSDEHGYDCIVPRNAVAELFGSFREISRSEYTARRISARIPSFPEELNPERLFSESQFMEAVSFKKGCYVGQEVITKLDTFGRLPRRLLAFKFPLKFEPALKAKAVHPETKEPLGILLSSGYLEANSSTFCFISVSESEESVDYIELEGSRGTVL